MRGPELHTLLVTRPDPLSGGAVRAPAGGVEEAPPAPTHRPVAPGEGVAPRRQLASGGYQVHNGRPAAPVVVG